MRGNFTYENSISLAYRMDIRGGGCGGMENNDLMRLSMLFRRKSGEINVRNGIAVIVDISSRIFALLAEEFR